VDRGLSIGEFSRITHLTVRMLRRYHDGGLLEPAVVDPVSGYRYYDLDQVPTAQAIRRFRELGMPVAALRDLLATADPRERDALVAAQLERLRADVARSQRAVAALESLLGPERSVEVELVDLPTQPVVAVRAEVSRAAVLAWYDAARMKIDAALGEAVPTGPLAGRYDHELFSDGHGEAVLYRPAPVSAGTEMLPGRWLAVVTHHGPHDDIDLSYATLGSWVSRAGIGAEGPVEELYDVGPTDDPDPSAWRTRVGWPVTGDHQGQTTSNPSKTTSGSPS
jgi:DNA-binding transcriptional MerR regulator